MGASTTHTDVLAFAQDVQQSTATAPIDPTGCPSNTGRHVRPEFSDFHSPPPTEPK